MNTERAPSNLNPQLSPSLVADQRDRLSALVDGELTAVELDSLLHESADASDLCAGWSAYHLIGDALRDPGFAPRLQAPDAFLAGVRARLQENSVDGEVAGLFAQDGRTAHLEQTKLPMAANDPVFRWKMVAGLASLAAVMAVSWTVLGNSRTGMDSGAAGGQLALMSPASVQGGLPLAAPVATSEGVQPVVINTARGTLIRDAKLEALLAEHRHGGVSALQMPAGFLRNATYDDAGR